MAGEVGGVGKGFFTESGELKSKSDIGREDQARITNKNEAAPVPATDDTSISTAVNSSRARFSEKANSILSIINQDEENLKAAQAAVKSQLEAAKELKTALKEEDKEKIARAQERLGKATEARNQLSQEIKKDNDRVVADRAKNLSLGNQQLGIVRTKAVELKKTSTGSPDDISEVNALIGELRSDRAEVVQQRKELRETRLQVKDAIETTDSQLSKVEDRSIRSLREAEDLAQKLSERITQNGAQALSATKISEQIVRQLLQ